MFLPIIVAFLLQLSLTQALYKEAFNSDVWKQQQTQSINDGEQVVHFTVALSGRNVDQMKQEFLEVSSPKSPTYGAYNTARELHTKYGSSQQDKSTVISYFEKSIEGASVKCVDFSDLCTVSAQMKHVEAGLRTKLDWHVHSKGWSTKTSLRAVEALHIDMVDENLISFISLNSPINHMIMNGIDTAAIDKASSESAATYDNSSSISVYGGNEQALLHFEVYCGDGTINTQSSPCSDLPADDIPAYTATVTFHANNKSDPYLLTTDPLYFTIPATAITCLNSYNPSSICNGAESAGLNCSCWAKLSPLPKYTQLAVTLSATFSNGDLNSNLSTSDLFALTDVATPSFLSSLYNIPAGLSVKHGSNQSVAEFYGEFFSNTDLSTFLSLAGLANQRIPGENVYGDYPGSVQNDQTSPGWEAQLDVEYIMAMAPGADTFFYSMDDYNPTNPPDQNTTNEGFLAFVQLVSTQEYPPLVFSLSYGDVEATIFNATNNGSIAYAMKVDEEFMKMGLRGLTVVFSSGDDGIGNNIIRDEQELACSQAWPAWPASSPYVTAIGATQRTDKYLPVCGMTYSGGASYDSLPLSEQLEVQCTGWGETTCSGSFGGVITSGGGFSNVYDREKYAPWQMSAVNAYLSANNSAAYPPLSYFNSSGRGYPDVSAYGSNYFVVKDGDITRVSGTSASAPVFAAMVTLFNDMRLAYNLPPMGFIAPFLYEAYASSPEAFLDVVTGDNACGVGSSLSTVPCCEYGFAASPGWDASTGLGSPNFQALSALILNNDTFFPALGAYPDGSDVYVATGGDDDDNEKLDNTFAIAVAALVTAGALLILRLFELSVPKSSGNNTNNNNQNQNSNGAQEERI